MDEPTGLETETLEREAREDAVLKDILESGGSVIHTWAHEHNVDNTGGHGTSVPEGVNLDQYKNNYQLIHGRRLGRSEAFVGTFGSGGGSSEYERFMGENDIKEAVIVDGLQYSHEGKYWGVPTTGLTRKPSADSLWRITYYATEGAREVLVGRNDADNHYRDGNDRSGNKLLMQIFLPQSLGNEVLKLVDENPFVMRKIVDQVVKKTYPKRFVDDTWNKYGKPPYEAWDKSGDSKMIVDKRWFDPRGFQLKDGNGADLRSFKVVPKTAKAA